MKKYIDERFIENEKGASKGIKQIIAQIQLLVNGEFLFDPECNEYLKSKKITVYPIICYNEIYFSMPGINEYLNDKFFENISKEIQSKIEIKNVTLIHLDLLSDMALRRENFSQLIMFINRYWKIITKRKKKYLKEKSIDNLLSYETSFDEMYESKFTVEIKSLKGGKDLLHSFIRIVDLSNEELETEL